MKIKLTEGKLKQIVAESVNRVLNETISTDYRESLKQLLTKAFTNLNDNEKQFLYDLLSNEPWETIYTALETIKPYNPSNVNESFNKVLKEGGYYSGEYDRTGLPLNDREYVESIEYVIDSIVNGNYKQALELIKNMDTSDRRELIKYAREVGYIDDLMNIMTEL